MGVQCTKMMGLKLPSSRSPFGTHVSPGAHSATTLLLAPSKIRRFYTILVSYCGFQIMLSPSLTLVLWFKSSKPLFWDPIYKAEPQSPFQNRPVTKLRPNNMIFLLCWCRFGGKRTCGVHLLSFVCDCKTLEFHFGLPFQWVLEPFQNKRAIYLCPMWQIFYYNFNVVSGVLWGFWVYWYHLNCDCKPLDLDFGFQLLAMSHRAHCRTNPSIVSDFYNVSIVSWVLGTRCWFRF